MSAPCLGFWPVQRQELNLLLAGQHQLAAVLKRISTPEEAALGLHAIQLMRRYRARHQQHEPFNKDVVWIFLQVCTALPGNALLLLWLSGELLAYLCWADHLQLPNTPWLQACAQAEAWDTMVAAFQHNHELGLGKMSLRLYGCALAELRKAGELHKLVKCACSGPAVGAAGHAWEQSCSV